MIPFKEAYKIVLEKRLDLGTETVTMERAGGRILAETITADRDFPPYNRATMDGITVAYHQIVSGQNRFKVEGIIPAGSPQRRLNDLTNCFEIMTGAVVPSNTDTVIPYEEIEIQNGYAQILKLPDKPQHIHYKGSDAAVDTELIPALRKIGPAEMGILATVGKREVKVLKLPNCLLVSTGDELVNVDVVPLPHQIRKSNVFALKAALFLEGIEADLIHLKDDKKDIFKHLSNALEKYDIILLSGGVSKGKYDYIPGVLEDLGVDKLFHRVAQRPGKPFWFGEQVEKKCLIFSFPGNPVSTFANYQVYFRNWLCHNSGQPPNQLELRLAEPVSLSGPLTYFKAVRHFFKNGTLYGRIIPSNGSGDFASLTQADGFVQLEGSREGYDADEAVPYFNFRPNL